MVEAVEAVEVEAAEAEEVAVADEATTVEEVEEPAVEERLRRARPLALRPRPLRDAVGGSVSSGPCGSFSPRSSLSL